MDLDRTSTMLDIVMVAFERAGGEAPFGRVYPIVKKIFKELGRPEPDELKAQVRQTVYLFCPASPNYLNQGDFFERTDRGRYRVKRPTVADLFAA